MGTKIETPISLGQTLFSRAENLAQQLNLSQEQLFEIAIENFIKNYDALELPEQNKAEISPVQPVETEQSPAYQDANSAGQSGERSRVINQGDIFWVQLADTDAPEAVIPHPYVIIQDDLFNHSRIHTVVACALTSNRRRVSDTPGNVLLEAGEANLPKQSVVEVSKVSTVDKARLGEYIGTLSEQRISQILAGMRFLQMTFFAR